MQFKTYRLWPTQILTTTYQNNIDCMIDEILNLSRFPNNIIKSNYGGWHSETNLFKNPKFFELCNFIDNFCNASLGLNVKFHQMWACINKKYDHNVIHTHNAYQLSGVFYLKTSKDCGDIVFRDPRSGALHSPHFIYNTHKKNFVDQVFEYFTPKENLIILFPSFLEHFVLPNLSDQDRISISFDLTFY